jgi:hypothetical protein
MVPIMCCHIADGNFHCCIPYKQDEKAKLQKVGCESRAVGCVIRT